MHSQVKMVEAIESCVEPAEQACNKEMGQDKEHREVLRVNRKWTMSVVNEEPDGTSDGERPKDGSIKT